LWRSLLRWLHSNDGIIEARLARRVAMEKILARLQSEDDEFRGFFSPEKTAMMKRVLEQVCREGNIRPDAIGECESLAIVILKATKNNANESELLILGRHAAKNY
jgi:hypothetical protein